jgi:GT2 family glycosyltransferase
MTAAPGDGPRVFALTVTFNAPHDELAKTVAAIHAQSLPPDELLIVDNHCDVPPRLEALRALGDVPIRVVRMDDNTGPGGGFAAGVEEFLRTECTHLWMLDDDVVADPDCLAELYATMASHDREVLVMPRMIDVRDGSTNDQITTWWGALVPRCAVEVAGAPRVDFFYSLEDQEYFLDRFPLAGFAITRTPAAVVRMLQREPTSIAAWKIYYIVRNTTYRYLWDRPHIATSTRVKSLLALLRFWWKMAWVDKVARRAKVTYYVRGVCDGLLRRLGKRVIPSSADRSWNSADPDSDASPQRLRQHPGGSPG